MCVLALDSTNIKALDICKTVIYFVSKNRIPADAHESNNDEINPSKDKI